MPDERDDVGRDPLAVDTELQGCPSDDELFLFAVGLLSAGRVTAVAQHVERCAVCRHRASTLRPTPGAVDTGALMRLEQPAAVAEAGQQLGRFTLVRLLGRGGMGEVWAAHDPELDREVAIKLLRMDDRGLDDDGHARLRREAQAMARLVHANVVRIYELGSDDDLVFCAMELVDGETLRQWLATPRPWRETLAVLLAAGRGVAAAHGAGLVHRDVKPDNVMIARDGRILVTDFGLARLAGRGAEPPAGHEMLANGSSANLALTRSGIMVGTPLYMAPEQLDGRTGDALSDQFAFCVTAYEALYRVRPYGGATMAELILAVHQGPAAPPRGRSAPPRGLWRCLLRGLAVQQGARWPSMAALLDAMERAARAPRRRLAVGLAACALVLSVLAVVVAARGREDDAAVRAAGQSRMSRAWSPERRDALRSAFARARDPILNQQGERTAAALDTYRGGWLAMRVDAWRATHERREQSERLLDQRMVCLDRLADEMEAFVQIAIEADRPDELRRVAQGAGGLTPVSTCASEAHIAAVFPGVIDPDDRPDAYRKVEGEEARLRAAVAGKPPGDAIAQIAAAVADAERTGVPGLPAGLLLLLASAQQEAADHVATEATLRRAIQEAARARRHPMVATAWIRLMEMTASKLSRPEAARALEPAARAAVAQAGDQPAQRAHLSKALSTISYIEGDDGASRDHLKQAIAGFRAAHGPRSVEVANAEVSLAMTYFQLDQLDEAVRHAQAGHEVARTGGPQFDKIAGKALMVLAWVARERRQWDAAARHGQDAVAALARLYGTDNLELAFARREVGLSLSQLGRHDEAIAQMRLCVEAARRVGGPAHPDVLDLQLELGSVYENAGRFADAERVDRAAVDRLRAEDPPRRDRLAHGLKELARMVAHRAPSEAAALYLEALGVAPAGDGK